MARKIGSRDFHLGDGMTLGVVGDSDGERFAEVFAATWSGIPGVWRDRILSHWRKGRARAKGGMPIPMIVLHNESLDHYHDGGRHRGNTGGHVAVEGWVMRFLGPLFDRIPAELAAGIIAHELAHVAQWAIGDMDRNADGEWHEIQASEWARAWGFPVEEIDIWTHRHAERYARGLPIWRKRPLSRAAVLSPSYKGFASKGGR